ncbi:MAG: hypothetical protein HUK04_07030 [Bacteroidaceae bacterium]|nr:hypothetical protein [Bacteroidaceae bacterium]
MSYLTFRERFIRYGCFSGNHVLMWRQDFDANNFTRWCKQGLLVRLRQGWYAFAECLRQSDFARFVAGRIYKPSYISLHTALSFYGMIPEAVVSINSVTTQKTQTFTNAFGEYTYQHVKPSLLFGFEIKKMEDGRAVAFALPEKALLDLLYLYPMYRTEDDMLELRLDEAFMGDELDVGRLEDYLRRFDCGALEERVGILRNAYGI